MVIYARTIEFHELRSVLTEHVDILRPVDTVIRRDFRLPISSLIFYSNLILNILYFCMLSSFFLRDSVTTPTEEFYSFHS